MAFKTASQRSEVSRADLEQYKDAIISLYWHENRTLREVMEIMRREYQFRATTRMYKSKFKEWGLSKNLSKSQAYHHRVQIHTGAASRPPVIYGREIGSKKFQIDLEWDLSYVKDLRQHEQESSLSTISHCLHAPESLRLAEGAIHAMQTYTEFCFETSVWEVDSHEFNHSLEKASSWWMDIRRAARLLGMQRDPSSGFQLIGNCLDRYGQLLIVQDPTFLTATLSAIMQLQGVGRELAVSLMRFVMNLSEIKLGICHPLTVLWSRLWTLGVSQVHCVASVALKAHYDSIGLHFKPDSSASTVFRVRALRQLSLFGKPDVQVIESKFVALLMDVECDNKRSNVDDVLIDFIKTSRSSLAGAAVNYVKTERPIDGQDGASLCQKIRGEIIEELGRKERPVVSLEPFQGSKFSPQTELYQLTDKLLDLQRFYLLNKDVEGAESCHNKLRRISEYFLAEIEPGDAVHKTNDDKTT